MRRNLLKSKKKCPEKFHEWGESEYMYCLPKSKPHTHHSTEASSCSDTCVFQGVSSSLSCEVRKLQEENKKLKTRLSPHEEQIQQRREMRHKHKLRQQNGLIGQLRTKLQLQDDKLKLQKKKQEKET